MANTSFKGPVRSEGGFQTIAKNPTTGAVTVTATYGDAPVLPNLPTVDPEIVGALWNDAGTLKVSAGPTP